MFFQLERIAKENPDSVSTAELLEKLKTTETKLEWWQSVKRQGESNFILMRIRRDPAGSLLVAHVHVATLFH